MWPNKYILLPVILAAGILPIDCNFATQSFNYGKLLNPSTSSFTVGGGKRTFHYFREKWKASSYIDSILKDTNNIYDYDWEIPDSLKYDIIKWDTTATAFAFQYRLGILAEKPLGNGLEIGYLVELPSSMDQAFFIYFELDARFGLKSFRLGPGYCFHNLAAGWGLGQWIDNTWYLEYAFGWEISRFLLYSNVRTMLCATKFEEDSVNLGLINEQFGLGRLNAPDRTWNNRLTAGCVFRMPDLPVLPEALIPELTFVFPNYHPSRGYGMTYHLGLRWRFK